MRDDYYTLPTVTLVAGQSKTLGFNLWTESGDPFNGDGCTGNFSVVNYSNKNTIVMSKVMAFESSEDDDVYNVATVDLDPSDTLGLYGKYVYQITIIDGDGDVEIPNQGIMLIARNINEDIIDNQ